MNRQIILQIIFIFTILLEFLSFSKSFYISSIVPETKYSIDSFTLEQLRKIQGPYESDEELRSYINEALLGTGLRNISYKLNNDKLHIKFDLLIRIKEVQVEGEVPTNFSLSPYLIKVNSYLEPGLVNNSIGSVEKILLQYGYKKPVVSVKRNGAKLIYNIQPGESRNLLTSSVIGGDPFLKRRYRNLIKNFYNKPIVPAQISRAKEELDSKMKEFGYLSLNTKLVITSRHVEIAIKYYGPYIFNTQGNKHFTTYELKKLFREQFRIVDDKSSENLVLNIVESHYKEAGFYDIDVQINLLKYVTNKLGQQIKRFDIKIKEGSRRRFSKTVFKGNRLISDSQLEKYYQSNSSSLLKGHYIDEKGAENLVKSFQKLYIENGYLSQKSRVKIPYTREEAKSSKVIDFIFNEGNQTVVTEFEVKDINENTLEDFYISKLREKYLEKPMNPFLIEDDIEQLESYIKSLGFIDARVVNENQKSLVSYSKDRSFAKIKLIVEKGLKHKLGNIYVFGNLKTKDKLVLKHINASGYKYITPTNLDEFKKNLFALGLFQSVSIEVKPSTQEVHVEGESIVADLIVRVKERDYGRVEIIPGLRSDTGAKLGFNLGYSNLGGMGRSLRWSSEISQRLSYSVFDEARNAEDNKFLEYAFDLSFTEIDFLKKNINYLAQLGTRRRRFFAFDARVSRFANTLSYNFPGVNLNVSIGHQYEAIKQENGSSASDNGEFKIGSLVPKLTYDWRDNLANPRSGGSHQLDIEWADRAWLSRDVNGESVNFTKYVLRNRFYVPFKGGTLALGWTAGIQQNAAPSSIPGIKIFRLTGIDQVRGFSDDEINRLPSGDDISQANLRKNAYLNSLKIEPRFFIGENLMLGAFWDAGRVTLDESRFFNLKQSVGLSLRILTPVGSINLDYGQKLSPEKFADGSIESSGRFHLSIGLF